MFRNLIFDWSGTLCDDLPPVIATVNLVLEHFGQAPVDEAVFRRDFKLPFGDFYEGRVKASADELERVYQDYYPQVDQTVSAIPFALPFLRQCLDAGCRCVLFSAVTPSHFHEQAEQLGVVDWFDGVYLGVRDKREVIAQVMAEQGFDPTETCFVGDMVHDVEAAHVGGIRSIAVATGYDSVAKLASASPHVIFQDLREFAYWLEVWNPLLRFPIATVGALIFDAKGQVLMIRSHKWQDKWGIPGGKIKRGELAEDALIREIREETALELEDISFVVCQDCVEPTEFERSAHFLLLNYTAQVVGEEPPRVKLNDEAEEFVWISPDKAWKLDLNLPTQRLLEQVCAPPTA